MGSGIMTGAFHRLFRGISTTDHEVAAASLPISQITNSRLRGGLSNFPKISR